MNTTKELDFSSLLEKRVSNLEKAMETLLGVLTKEKLEETERLRGEINWLRSKLL